MDSPKTLLEAIQYFSGHENCRNFMVDVRWADGVVRCPKCGNEKVSYLEKAKLYFCPNRHPKQKFSLKVGTIFEDSPIGLDKWLPAAWLIANCKNGISSYEMARAIGVTQKSAWHMLHRLRVAMKPFLDGTKFGSSDGGAVEVDEAFVGGKLANMHRHRAKAIRANVSKDREDDYETGWYGKAAVLGMYDRESRTVRAKVVPNVKRETLQKEILKNVKYGSSVFTDEAVAYNKLGLRYVHDTVNHAEAYVNGQVHTNSLENFWSLMKRNLAGTYVAVEPFHLDKYIDEQVFRFNNRQNKTDADRFKKLLSQIVGKRLTYAEVTGKVGETAF
ncbi:MAG TPA: IS1595 family transposase [Acidobacteriaceae bacterium]|nr:IS1595 family transposase [Acidobacteriaceae bacterium]